MLKASKHEAPSEIRCPIWRAVGDDDVDRRQVQGLRGPQPSRTNSPNPFRRGRPPGKRTNRPRAGRAESRVRKVAYAYAPCPVRHAVRSGRILQAPSWKSAHAEAAAAPATHTETTANGIKAATARGLHLFPFRTEKLNPGAPMILRKRESRSPPPPIREPVPGAQRPPGRAPSFFIQAQEP